MLTTSRPEQLRVLELGSNAGLALCGKWLAVLGLAVTRVDEADPVQAPPVSAELADAYLNAGKQRLRLDLDSASGQAAIRRLLADSDLFITSLPQERLRGLALDFDSISAGRCITMGRISELGEHNEQARLKGHDLQALALSGLLYIVGEPEQPPLALAGPQASYSAGLSLLSGLMFAVSAMDRDPRSRQVSTSCLQAAVYLDWKSQIYCEAEGKVLKRGSDKGPIIVRCADGYLGFYYRPGDWENVKRVVGSSELAEPRFAVQADRDRHRGELREALERALAQRSKHEVFAAAQAAGIPVGAVLTLPDLLTDPQYRARDFWEHLSVPGHGEQIAPAVPWTVSGTRPQTPRISSLPAGETEVAP
ncbi:MAG: CoA transferase [Burkholderiales bacterium]|nr:CoA transferase [Burkholderiales bacterium]ODU67603.1 MAG: hypothetical protein ABT05_03490 [Lautropia sp. SCN 66-9]